MSQFDQKKILEHQKKDIYFEIDKAVKLLQETFNEVSTCSVVIVSLLKRFKSCFPMTYDEGRRIKLYLKHKFSNTLPAISKALNAEYLESLDGLNELFKSIRQNERFGSKPASIRPDVEQTPQEREMDKVLLSLVTQKRRFQESGEKEQILGDYVKVDFGGLSMIQKKNEASRLVEAASESLDDNFIRELGLEPDNSIDKIEKSSPNPKHFQSLLNPRTVSIKHGVTSPDMKQGLDVDSSVDFEQKLQDQESAKKLASYFQKTDSDAQVILDSDKTLEGLPGSSSNPKTGQKIGLLSSSKKKPKKIISNLNSKNSLESRLSRNLKHLSVENFAESHSELLKNSKLALGSHQHLKINALYFCNGDYLESIDSAIDPGYYFNNRVSDAQSHKISPFQVPGQDSHPGSSKAINKPLALNNEVIIPLSLAIKETDNEDMDQSSKIRIRSFCKENLEMLENSRLEPQGVSLSETEGKTAKGEVSESWQQDGNILSYTQSEISASELTESKNPEISLTGPQKVMAVQVEKVGIRRSDSKRKIETKWVDQTDSPHKKDDLTALAFAQLGQSNFIDGCQEPVGNKKQIAGEVVRGYTTTGKLSGVQLNTRELQVSPISTSRHFEDLETKESRLRPKTVNPVGAGIPEQVERPTAGLKVSGVASGVGRLGGSGAGASSFGIEDLENKEVAKVLVSSPLTEILYKRADCVVTGNGPQVRESVGGGDYRSRVRLGTTLEDSEDYQEYSSDASKVRTVFKFKGEFSKFTRFEVF